MDLLSEASSGTRVLAARHISADKSFPETNNEINTTLLCHSYSVLPDFSTYLTGLQPYAWVLLSCDVLFLVAIFVLYVITVRSALAHWRDCISNVAIVVAVYPLVAAAAFLAVLLPRVRILAEALAQQAVMFAMYHLFCTFIAECGGHETLVRSAAGAKFQMKGPPCCCWPCCVLPRPKIKKQTLQRLRYLVIQMPVIQGLVYVISLVLWLEDVTLYQRCFTFLQPFIFTSVLSGMWGMMMTASVTSSVGRKPRPRLIAVQCALVIVKLQCALTKILPDIVRLPCILPLHPAVFVNTIQYSVMLLEMLLLSIWSWRLYRVPPGKTTDKIQHVVVAVLDDSTRALDVKPMKDGVDNKSFNNKCEL